MQFVEMQRLYAEQRRQLDDQVAGQDVNRDARIVTEVAARENERAAREELAESGKREIVDAADGAVAMHVDERDVREPTRFI